MNKKILGILVMMLLIATTALSVVDSTNINKNQDVNTLDEPDVFQKPSRRLSKPLLLPPFLLQLVNGGWNYWSNPPHVYVIPEGNIGIGTSYPESKLEVAGTVTAESFIGDGSGLTNVNGSGWSHEKELDCGENKKIYKNNNEGDVRVTVDVTNNCCFSSSTISLLNETGHSVGAWEISSGDSMMHTLPDLKKDWSIKLDCGSSCDKKCVYSFQIDTEPKVNLYSI